MIDPFNFMDPEFSRAIADDEGDIPLVGNSYKGGEVVGFVEESVVILRDGQLVTINPEDDFNDGDNG